MSGICGRRRVEGGGGGGGGRKGRGGRWKGLTVRGKNSSWFWREINCRYRNKSGGEKIITNFFLYIYIFFLYNFCAKALFLTVNCWF